MFSTGRSEGRGLTRLLNKFVGDNATVIFPILPAMAATLLQTQGHDVVWLDGIAEGWDWEQYCKEVELAKPGLMMIETKTPPALEVYSCIADLKVRFPEMKVVLVGDHITAFPEEAFLYCPVDYTIRGGQFDFALLNLANFLSGREDLASGVFWNDNGEFKNSGVIPHPPTYVQLSPHIDRELVRWKLYAYRNGNFLKTPGTYGWAIGTSGGDCWWRRPVAGGPKHGGGGCTFCSWTSLLPTFSVRPVNDYLDELETLAAMGVKEVFDDTGTFPTGRWLKDFCKGFRERGLHKVLMMGCNMRADALSRAEYEMLAECNFRFILYGIESANQRTLDLLNKGTTVQQERDSLKWASEAGLEPHATIMMGYPWESYEEAKRTVEFSRECFDRGWINTLQGTIVMPYHTFLLHGGSFSVNATTFQFVFELLAAKPHVYALDHFGHGLSSRKLAYGPTFDVVVDAMREFMDVQGLQSVNIVGHSAGGWIGPLLAYESPDRVRKLVIVGGAGMNNTPVAGVQNQRVPTKESALRGATNSIYPGSAMTAETADLMAEQIVELSGGIEGMEGFKPHNDQMADPASRRQYLLHRRLPYIRVPTMVMWGKGSPGHDGDTMEPYPTWTAEYDSVQGDISKTSKPWVIPGAKYVMSEGGHNIHWEHPQEFTEVVLDFLA